MISKGDISASPSDSLHPRAGWKVSKTQREVRTLSLSRNNCQALHLSPRKVSDGALLHSMYLRLRSSFFPGEVSAGGEHVAILEVF